MQFDTAAARVRNGEGCLQTEERLVLHADLVRTLDDDITRGVDVAAHDALVPDHVAVGMDVGRSAGDRRLGVEQRLEQLVLHDDCREGPAARLGMVGGDRCHGLAHVTHDLGGEHRLVVADQPVVQVARHVVGRDDGLDPVDPPGAGEVDRADAGVRVRRPQRGAPQTSVGVQVGGERERALDLLDTVGPARRRADRAVATLAPRDDRSTFDDGHDASPRRTTATRCTASMMRP